VRYVFRIRFVPFPPPPQFPPFYSLSPFLPRTATALPRQKPHRPCSFSSLFAHRCPLLFPQTSSLPLGGFSFLSTSHPFHAADPVRFSVQQEECVVFPRLNGARQGQTRPGPIPPLTVRSWTVPCLRSALIMSTCDRASLTRFYPPFFPTGATFFFSSCVRRTIPPPP